jgi:glycolate oxidase FAD binding subunit
VGVAARSVGAALAAVVGAARLTDDPGRCASAVVDGLVPRWVASPSAPADLSALVALAHDAGLAVAPRGSGSALELGAPASRVDLVIDTRGLDRIVDYNPDDLTVTVEAGVSARALAARLADRRQMLAIDPPGGEGRTIGGLVATNGSGPLRARYGTLRDLVLGVRFVQADGVLTWGGAKVVKSVTGYDVPKLMVGSLGTLGVLAEVTLRLHPAPEAEQTWLVTFATAEAAQAFAALVVDSALQPNRLEFLNAPMLRGCGLTGSAAVAIAFGSVDDAVRAQGEVAASLARRSGGDPTPARRDFWPTYARAGLSGQLELRLSVPAGRLAAIAAEVDKTGAAGAPAMARLWGCCAIGALRAGLEVAGPADAAAAVERLRALVGPDGGSVVIERGPRELRSRIDPWGPVEPGPLALMRGLKDAFDPTRVLNPGRFVGGI